VRHGVGPRKSRPRKQATEERATEDTENTEIR
jgi:hypothetical protein